MCSIGWQQGYAAISQLQGADHREQDGVYLTVNTPDFIATGEQKTGITLVKTSPSRHTKPGSHPGWTIRLNTEAAKLLRFVIFLAPTTGWSALGHRTSSSLSMIFGNSILLFFST